MKTWGTSLLNAIGYIRVSREEQAESHLSLDAQRAQIEAYCTFKSLTLVDVICDEAVSGGNLFSLAQEDRHSLHASLRVRFKRS